MTSSDKLFEFEDRTKDPRLEIPEMLGRSIGTFMDLTRYVEIILKDVNSEDIDDIYVPCDDSTSLVSDGYAEDSKFDGQLTYWKREHRTKNKFQGYLAGFPRILNEDQYAVDCLHIWEDNADVFSCTQAIPLLAVKGLFAYSKLRTKLEADRDELSWGDNASRWEIPVARSKTTKEVIYRDASCEDIDTIIEVLDEAPGLAYGDFGTTKVQLLTTEEKLHLLD